MPGRRLGAASRRCLRRCIRRAHRPPPRREEAHQLIRAEIEQFRATGDLAVDGMMIAAGRKQTVFVDRRAAGLRVLVVLR